MGHPRDVYFKEALQRESVEALSEQLRRERRRSFWEERGSLLVGMGLAFAAVAISDYTQERRAKKKPRRSR